MAKHLSNGTTVACGVSRLLAIDTTMDPQATECPECLWALLKELRAQEAILLGLIRMREKEARVEVINPVQRG